MRLWHKDLISVLPKAQLISQWRELSAIATKWIEDGTPNNILVNFVTKYSPRHFISFAHEVREEMERRGYKTSDAVWCNRIIAVDPDWDDKYLDHDLIYYNKMTREYLKVCCWNLYEKAICNGMPKEEYEILHPFFQEYIK